VKALKARAQPRQLLRPENGRHRALSGLVSSFRGSNAYRKAIKVFESLVRLRPYHARYRSHLAALYNDLAVRLWRARRENEARDAFGRALAIQGRLAAERPCRRHESQLVRIRKNLATTR